MFLAEEFNPFLKFVRHPRHSLRRVINFFSRQQLSTVIHAPFVVLNDRWARMRLLGRFAFVHNLMFHLYRSRSSRVQYADSLFPAVEIEEVVAALRADGFYVGLVLPHDVRREILDFATRMECYGDLNPQCGLSHAERSRAEAKVGKRFLIGQFFNASTNCQAIRALESDPKLLAISRKYVGRDARHVGTNLWWSYPIEEAPPTRVEHGQAFHFDLDDYRFLKIFFYLTDVDDLSGPHMFVRGTHKKRRLNHQLIIKRFSDQDIVRSYGRDNLVTISGPAGMGFAEDTFGLHKGIPPTQKERLVLQMEFAVNDYNNTNDNRDPSQLKSIL